MPDLLVLAQGLLGFVEQLLRVVADSRRFPPRLILRFILARILHGAANLVLAHVACGGNRNLLLIARSHVLRRNGHDAVRVDGKRHLDLRNARHRAANALQTEIAEQLIVLSIIAFALQNLDINSRLERRGGRENLAVAGRDGRVPVDDFRRHAADRFDGQRQRRHIHQDDALRRGRYDHAVSRDELAALKRRAHRHAFIRIHIVRGHFSGQLFDHLLHGGHARASADKQYLPQIAHAQCRIGHHLTDRSARPLHKVAGHSFKLRPRHGHIQMMRSVHVLRQKRQRDLRTQLTAQLPLCLFSRFADAEHRGFVAPDIHLFSFLEFVGEIIRQPLVKVIAAEMVVAAGGKHFNHAVTDFDERHIKRAAAEVIDQNLLCLPVIQAIGKRRRSRLVDDAQNIQPRNASGVARRLTLTVRKIRRNGDDRLRNRLTQKRFRVPAELLENHRGNLLRRIALSVDFHAVIAAHFALDG